MAALLPPRSSRARRAAAVFLVALVVPALAWPAILRGILTTPAGSDQVRVHLGVIDDMAKSFRALPLRDYAAAAAPGYHIGMAVVFRLFHPTTTGLQLVSSLFGLALVAVVAAPIAARQDPGRLVLLALPFAVSCYVISGSVWLMTDNAAWLFALGALAVLVIDAPPSPARLMTAGVLGALSVGARQVHIWVALPILVAGWKTQRRWSAVAAALPLIPGLVLLILWRGLAPPAYVRAHVAGWNPASIVLTLVLFGALGAAALPLVGLGTSTGRRTLVFSGAAALLAALAVPMSFDQAAGRWGGPIWWLARLGPTIAGRSIPFAALAALGGVVLARLLLAARAAEESHLADVLSAAVIGFALAESLNHFTFERYFDPFVLAVVAWLAAASLKRTAARWRLVPMAVLALVMLAVTIGSLYERPASLTPRVFNSFGGAGHPRAGTRQ